MFLFAEEIDTRMGWRPGKAERLARQRRLPHILLPDGSIRFDWAELEALIVRIPPASAGEGARTRDIASAPVQPEEVRRAE
jgi:hypothetical protein